jgi:hypothetical protein
MFQVKKENELKDYKIGRENFKLGIGGIRSNTSPVMSKIPGIILYYIIF